MVALAPAGPAPMTTASKRSLCAGGQHALGQETHFQSGPARVFCGAVRVGSRRR
jgi:hypothetical protein